MHPADDVLEDTRRAGIDLDLLDANLALTCKQRVLRHESALELVPALKEAGVAPEKFPSRNGPISAFTGLPDRSAA